MVLVPPIVLDNNGNPTDLLRVGPHTEMQVYFMNSDGVWELSKNTIVIPEGWYIVPPEPKGDSQ